MGIGQKPNKFEKLEMQEKGPNAAARFFEFRYDICNEYIFSQTYIFKQQQTKFKIQHKLKKKKRREKEWM